jgi:Fe-S-cluster containining protein
MHGYYDAYILEEEDGVKTVRTFSDGSCVFLDKGRMECEVYDDRPEHCKLRPVTISTKTKKPVVDKMCKHSKEFKSSTEMKKRMTKLFKTFKDEVAWRRKTGYF